MFATTIGGLLRTKMKSRFRQFYSSSLECELEKPHAASTLLRRFDIVMSSSLSYGPIVVQRLSPRLVDNPAGCERHWRCPRCFTWIMDCGSWIVVTDVMKDDVNPSLRVDQDPWCSAQSVRADNLWQVSALCKNPAFLS